MLQPGGGVVVGAVGGEWRTGDRGSMVGGRRSSGERQVYKHTNLCMYVWQDRGGGWLVLSFIAEVRLYLFMRSAEQVCCVYTGRRRRQRAEDVTKLYVESA